MLDPATNGDALRQRAVRVMPGGNTRTTVFVPPFPPYALRGSGYSLVDVDGHEVVDFLSNYTAAIHGHGNPEITEAVTSSVARGAGFGMPSVDEVTMAEVLSQRMPALERLRFTSSGTEAVMMAIRAARAATGRRLIIRFAGSYHGAYDDVIPCDASGIASTEGVDVVEVPAGDADALSHVIAVNHERVAAVLIDLMPNRAGLEPADRGFVATLARQTRAAGALLIVDEVITSRLGLSGLHGAYELIPDLVVLGKWVGGGLPIGVFGGRADVMQVFDPDRPEHVDHGGTFSANPVSLAAGLIATRLLPRPEIDRINRLGDRLREGLRSTGYTVAGRGSLVRVGAPGRSRAELWWRFYRAGVLIGSSGLMCTSTVMDEGVVDAALKRLASAAV